MRSYLSLLVLALATAGCAQPATSIANIQSDDVNERILAIRQAGERRDRTAVPLLVDRLEDEDEAVRFFAILALDRITGRRFGYEYAQPAIRRADSVEAWREFLKDPDRISAIEGSRQATAAGGSPNAAASDN